MKKILALFGIVVFGCGTVYAADIVYPIGKYNKTNHDSVYFMGTLEKGETLQFQNQQIKPAANGAFAINIPVSAGRSQVFLRICKDGHSIIKQYYIIKNRQKTVQTPAADVLLPLGRTVFKTGEDNTALYSTPEPGDLNILSRMAENTHLIIDGRQGNFYRVYLTPTRYGWVHKNDVRMVFDNNGCPAQPTLADFYNVDDKTVPDLSLYRVAFSLNLPYELIDNPNELIINIFNVAGMIDETLILKVSKHELVKYSTGFTNGDFTLLMKGCKRQTGLPLAGFNIVVDAGHGGQDAGALGMFRDNEKDITLQTALKLKDELEKKGASVYLTRNTDYDVPLYDRIKLAKAYDANILVSIHMGATPQGENPLTEGGTKVYYGNESAKQLAENIKSGVISKLATDDAGINRSGMDILQPTEYLGVSIDLCNMVNPDDSVIYHSDKFTQKAAEGISTGILKYISAKQNTENSGHITNLQPSEINNKVEKQKWHHFFHKLKQVPDRVQHKRIKVKTQPMPVNEEDAAVPPDDKRLNGTDWLDSTMPTDKTDIGKNSPDTGTEKALLKHRKKHEKIKHTEHEKPFLDTSVREKYQQEAIYFVDKDDTRWWRPRGKKKRVKRPPRVIKQDVTIEEHPVNIFASGDYEEPEPEQLTFGERCRNFLSKLTSYFYNAARN